MITAKQIAKLARICAKINKKPTSREETGNNPTVFFMFFGHTHSVEIRVHYRGWSTKEQPDCMYTFFDNLGWCKQCNDNYTGTHVTLEQIMQDLQQLKEGSK